MKKILLGTAVAAAALALPTAASAQALPAPTIAVIDVQRIVSTCTACVAANTQYQAQLQAARSLAQQLGAPLQTEGQSIQAAVNALPAGAQPDPTLRARIARFQQQQASAQQQLETRQAQVQANQQYIIRQIFDQLNPIMGQVSQQRGATVTLDAGATIAHMPSIDITDAVLAALNQRLTSINVNAPPPSATPAAPVPTPTPTPTAPRPRGR